MKEFEKDTVWIVVLVQSGIPVLAEVFPNRRAAQKRERELRREINPENDEVGVFSSEIVCSKRRFRKKDTSPAFPSK